MADPTRPAPHRDVPVPDGWCHWHGDIDPTSRVVLEVDCSSGPPHDQSACASCCARHGLTPLEDLPNGGHLEPSSTRPQQREGR